MPLSITLDYNTHAYYDMHINYTEEGLLGNTFHFIVRINHFCILRKFQSMIPIFIQSLEDRTEYDCNFSTQIPICPAHTFSLKTHHPKCSVAYRGGRNKYNISFELLGEHMTALIQQLHEVSTQIDNIYTAYRQYKLGEFREWIQSQTSIPMDRYLWELRDRVIADEYKYLTICIAHSTLPEDVVADSSAVLEWTNSALDAHTPAQLDLVLQGFGDLHPRCLFSIFHKHRLLMNKLNAKINYNVIMGAWCRADRISNYDMLTQKWIRLFQDAGQAVHAGLANRFFTAVVGFIAFQTGDYSRYYIVV